MSSTKKYNWQSLTEERFTAVQQLFTTNEKSAPSKEKLQGLLAMLGDNANTYTLLAVDAANGTAVAFGLLLPQNQTALLDVTVNLAHQTTDVGQRLIGKLLAQAESQADSPLLVRATVSDEDEYMQRLHSQCDFDRFITQIRMRCDLNQPLPEIPIPDAIQLVPYAETHSDQMRLAFNEAFANHWIGNLTPEAWQSRFIATQQFAPNLTYVALAEREVAGFYLSENLGEQNGGKEMKEAWLEIVGVVPNWRGRRLGAALVTHALHCYKANGFTHAGLDVDLENSTNAIKLYERLGFEKVKGTIYFHK